MGDPGLSLTITVHIKLLEQKVGENKRRMRDDERRRAAERTHIYTQTHTHTQWA